MKFAVRVNSDNFIKWILCLLELPEIRGKMKSNSSRVLVFIA